MKKTISFFFMTVAFAIAMTLGTVAQNTNTTKEKTTDETKAEVNEDEIFGVPEGATADELIEHVQKMTHYRPTGENVDMDAFMQKRLQAMSNIADAILRVKDATDSQKEMAISLKISVIMTKNAISAASDDNTPSPLAELTALLEEFKTVDGSITSRIKMLIFQLRLQDTLKADDQEAAFKEEFAKVKEIYAKDGVTPANAQMASICISFAGQIKTEEAGKIEKLIVRELKPFFEKSDDATVKKVFMRLEGTLRFKELVGKEMQLECLLLGGKKLDIKDLKDKVVLVDFWATWCGPCLGELPNLKKNYEKYHKHGFEIIGYSIDSNVDQLHAFEEKDPHAWYTASSVLSVETGMTDYADYYGINSIPRMILVGKDGKVISTAARGAALDAALAEQFPDVKDEQEKTEAKK